MTEPASAKEILAHDPFARAGHTGHPACLLATWVGGEVTRLTEDECQRIERLQSSERRAHLAGSLALRRQLIAKMAGCDAETVRLAVLPEGAPELVNPPGWALSPLEQR